MPPVTVGDERIRACGRRTAGRSHYRLAAQPVARGSTDLDRAAGTCSRSWATYRPARARSLLRRGALASDLARRRLGRARRSGHRARAAQRHRPRDRQPLRAGALGCDCYLARSEERFGLILCDPPYRLADRLEPALAEHLPPRLAKHGRLAVECSARRPLELDLPLLAERGIGEALIRVWSER
jgi:hypothetical protein